MAKAFSAFNDNAEIVIFASGVSNSLETSQSAFCREKDLLRRTRDDNPGALLVYFGTCSAEDPDRRETPYVRHKIEMESILAASPYPWMVLRLPLAIGRGHRGQTLARYLHERILLGEPIEVWAHSIRYPIDVEDVVRIATRLVGDQTMWNRRINIALRAFSVLDFVRIIEEITGRSATYTLVQKGQHYELQCPEVARLASELQLDFSEGYLELVLRKYFEREQPIP